MFSFLGGRGGRGGGGRRGGGRTRSGHETLQEDVVSNSIEDNLDSNVADPHVKIKLEPEDHDENIATVPEDKKADSGPKSKTWFPGSRNAKYGNFMIFATEFTSKFTKKPKHRLSRDFIHDQQFSIDFQVSR